MFFVDTIEVSGLGNRSCLAGGERTDVAVDPPRDVDQVIAAVAGRGVRISHVVETRVHNDYVTGGLELARITGAAYLVPVSCAPWRRPVTPRTTPPTRWRATGRRCSAARSPAASRRPC